MVSYPSGNSDSIKSEIAASFAARPICSSQTISFGNPNEIAKKYYQEGADELIYSDCVASLYGRKSLLNLTQHPSSNVFIPVSAGGGLKSIKDIEEALIKVFFEENIVNSRNIETDIIYINLI